LEATSRQQTRKRPRLARNTGLPLVNSRSAQVGR
jgi:hypothetical protein